MTTGGSFSRILQACLLISLLLIKPYAFAQEEVEAPNPESAAAPAGMALIPAGEFILGVDNSRRRAGPAHKVYVDAFFMDSTEVTQERYEKLIGENPSKFKGPKRPVERITWFEARDYCEKKGKRLPTEAEWTYASRAGSTTLYPWGDKMLSWKANFCDVHCTLRWKNKHLKDGYEHTAPVGQYPTNDFGLFDMFGNVWEWVWDWQDADYYADSPYKNPQGPSTGKHKLYLGNSWFNQTRQFKSYNRYWHYPYVRSGNVGFRCAK